MTYLKATVYFSSEPYNMKGIEDAIAGLLEGSFDVTRVEVRGVYAEEDG